MKIAIFSAFYPFRGGISQFNARLLRSLDKEHKVEAFTFKKQYPDFLFPGTSQYVQPGDRVDKIQAHRIVSTFNPFTYFEAARSIRSAHPDLFVTNYWMTFFAPFMGVMANRQKRGTKKIAIIHNLIPHEPRFFDSWLNRFFVKRYDGFIVMSDAVEKDLLSIRPDAKYIRIGHPWYDHFGVQEDRREASVKLGIDPDKKTILFFGLIRDYKGLDLLIEAVGRLDESYQLLIAGEIYGSEKKYTDQIRVSPASDRIYLMNRYIPDEEVASLFSASDVCVLPYRTATQSGITATAFHFEVPIIATNVGGLKETLKDGALGSIVERPDADMIANSLIHYFEDGLFLQYVENIKQQKALNSWDQFALQMVEFSKTL
jgi:glycosyltransferase involved in cell wall biosynthesis